MASNRFSNTSSEPFNRQSSGSGKYSRQESTATQLDRAVRESSKILQSVTGNPKGFSSFVGRGWSNTKRLPRQYLINNNQTILLILQGDITRTKVDAIVNAANEHMTGGSGVDGIIHDAAGNDLYEACKRHKQVSPGVRLPTGHSRILLSYNMVSTTYYIINTAGPVYHKYKAEECAKDLASCYKTAIALANLYDLESIGFTAISCGIFGYPADDGAEVALRTVEKEAGDLPVVVFVLWDDHIYDAWVKKAEELRFAPYDPQSPLPITPSKVSNDNQDEDDKEKSTKNPVVKRDTEESTTKSIPVTTTVSTENEPEKMSQEQTEDQAADSSSAPTDTQNTQSMDQDEAPPADNVHLTSQKTTDMRDLSQDKENATQNNNNNSEEKPAQEGNNKTDDQTTKVNAAKSEHDHSTDEKTNSSKLE